MSAFENVAATYEEFGEQDPFYAVLSIDEFRKETLDKNKFFEIGRQQINKLMTEIQQKEINVRRKVALDFGCGVGRLTNAFGRHFDKVVGVDVSNSMVATAQAHRYSENCSFVVNKEQDLSLFGDGEFDFIYSDITLQHIPQPASLNYIKDFIRILRPGGTVVFQVPDGPDLRPGSISFRLNQFYRQQVRPWHKRIRGKLPVQVHYVARPHVESIINNDDDAELIRVQPFHPGKNRRSRYGAWYYWVQKNS